MEGNVELILKEGKLHICKTNLIYLELKPENQALEWKIKERHLGKI